MRAASLALLVVMHSAVTLAQPTTDPAATERPSIGAVAGAGIPGPLTAIRASGPAGDRFGWDLDLGIARESGDTGAALGGQVRWIHGGRKRSGNAGYVVLGLLAMNTTTETEIRFPGETVVRRERQKVLGGQFGYGWDWQTSHGFRAGIEIAQGGSEGVYRLFIKTFVVWGTR